MRPEPPLRALCVSGLVMHLVVLDADTTRIRFEAACHRLGDGEARRAFSMALNKEGRKAYTAHRRELVKQTSIPRPVVAAALRFDSARRNRLETRITGSGRHLPLSVFKPRQFSYGVRAKVWGRHQTYRSAFLVRGFGNEAFKRVGQARLPIERLWGPAVPSEMLRDEAVAVWQDQLPAVDAEAKRLMGLLLGGHRIGLRRQATAK